MIGNGFGWTEPVLEDLQTIRLQDALLEERDGKMGQTVWPQADYIIGNPPFLGRQVQREELGDEYTELLRATFAGQLTRGCDLACYFFEQARTQVASGNAQRVGLLANTTIRQVDNREVLERIDDTGDIFLAWTNLLWTLDGADLRIAIVGFDDGTEQVKFLNGETVPNITSTLDTGTFDESAVVKLQENVGSSFQGPIKVGPFDIDGELAHEWSSLPANVNGRNNTDVVKPYVNGSEITRRLTNRWIVDFPPHFTLEEAAKYEAPFEYVRTTVRPFRDKQKHEFRRTHWWLHGSPAKNMREALNDLSRYLVTPRVAKHRLFAWLVSPAYPGDRLVVFAREDNYFFGVLHSRAHEVWSLRMASRHGVGNDPTYNNTTCFETFPLPWPPGEEPVDDPRVQAIAAAAKSLDDLREIWLNPADASDADLKKRTLTNLYNAHFTWLANAHATLDHAVWDAYGWDDPEPATVAEDVILGRLLALNGERAESSGRTSAAVVRPVDAQRSR
jgi:hypothetical protein